MKLRKILPFGLMMFMLTGCQSAQDVEVDYVRESSTDDEATAPAKFGSDRSDKRDDNIITGDIYSETKSLEQSDEESKIDSETLELLYGYYRQYNPLLEDENAELLQLYNVSYGDICLDYAYLRGDCYEELNASLANYDSDTYDTEKLYAGLCVHRADQELLSYIKIRISDGAATEYISHTFDVASGRELALEDVVTDIDSLMEAVTGQAGKEAVSSDLEAWTVGYEGLTVYLRADTDEAKPIYLSYEQYSDLFEERVKHIPARYAVGFKQYNDLIADVDKDGEPDVIRMELVYGISDADGEKADGGYIVGFDYAKDERLSEVVLKIGEYEISCPAYQSYDHDCGGYYIQNDDGQRYIYVYIKGNLDWEYTYHIIRLDSEGPVYVGEAEGDFYSSRILTDPQKIKMETECCWGTSGFRKYDPLSGIPQDKCLGYVGAEGDYTRDEDILYWYCGEIFTAEEDVEGISVDVDGTVSEDTVTIEEGENVVLLRIDFSGTYADYIRADGKLCRVETNYDWW